MTPPTEGDVNDLVISDDANRTFRPLLACGHYGHGYPPDDVVWDAKPTVPVWCPTCGDDRYVHGILVRYLLESMDATVRAFMEDWKHNGSNGLGK